MELRITNDAQKEISLKQVPLDSGLMETPFFEVWGVHVFGGEVENYFLFTEAASLFSLVVPCGLVNTPDSFELLFRRSVGSALAKLFEGPVPKYFEVPALAYAKTRNDGLRRAQADQIWRAQDLLDQGQNTFAVNRVPYKSIGFQFPVELFIRGVRNRMRAHGDFSVFVPKDTSVN